MISLDHSLERTVLICATRELVFRYFTDSKRFASWWGEGSTIDPRPGGAVRICYPGTVVALGQVVELQAPERIVFTYGYEDPAKPIPPGGSRVTITLEQHSDGTLLKLRHDLADAAVRDDHAPGWRFQLSLFANVTAREQHAQLESTIDRYLSSWNDSTDLAEVVARNIVVKDSFACINGLDDLNAHIAASKIHMPGMKLERSGPVRQCQGIALADWVATDPSGTPRARGTNVYDLTPDGKLTRVVGFWQG